MPPSLPHSPNSPEALSFSSGKQRRLWGPAELDPAALEASDCKKDFMSVRELRVSSFGIREARRRRPCLV